MSKRKLTTYQQGVVGRYYDNLDAIMLQKLQELVTELYLAETAAKQKQLWEKVAKAMAKLKVRPAIAEHIMAKQDVQTLAENVQDWLKNTG